MKLSQIPLIIPYLLMLLFPGYICAQESVSIKGHVCEDSSGKPLPGVTVVIKGPGTYVATVTDLDGKFGFENVTTGKFKLNAYCAGYISKMVKNIPLDTANRWVFKIELSRKTKDGRDECKRINYEKSINNFHDDIQEL